MVSQSQVMKHVDKSSHIPHSCVDDPKIGHNVVSV